MYRLAFIIVLLCLPRLSEAQPELSLSLKAGPNAAIWDREHHEHNYGLSGGLAGDLRWPFVARFSLGAQMALLYMPRGTESFSRMTGEFLGIYRQHYFDISVAIRPEARVGSVGVYILLGGSWSILLNANVVDELGRKRDLDAYIRRHDVVLLAGLGARFISLPTGWGLSVSGPCFSKRVTTEVCSTSIAPMIIQPRTALRRSCSGCRSYWGQGRCCAEVIRERDVDA
jgi:hypothetical protein